jgi:adenosylcobinamide-GDP ribazoletransferase
MSGIVRSAAAAVTFLTRMPLGRLVQVEKVDVAHGAWFFPAIGGAVGGVSGLLADVVGDWLPSLAAGAIAVGAAALLTGAMHLDALADSADALGAPTRQRALEIMRDHSVGAFGATALIVVLVVDAALFGSLAQTDDAALAGLAAGAAGRATMLLPALILPYARAEEGQGRLLDGIGAATLVSAVVLATLLALPIGVPGLWGLGAAALTAGVLTLLWRQRFGGMTGDLLGATAKLAETAALVTVAAAVL